MSAFELPSATQDSPAQDDFSTPVPTSRKPAPIVLSEKKTNVMGTVEEAKDLKRRLHEVECALRRSHVENQRLRDRFKEKIKARQEEAVEKKRQRDEANIQDKKHAHDMFQQLKDERAKSDEIALENKRLQRELQEEKEKNTQVTTDLENMQSEREQLLEGKGQLDAKVQQTSVDFGLLNEELSKRKLMLDTTREKLAYIETEKDTLQERLNEALEHTQQAEGLQRQLMDEITEARLEEVRAKDLSVRLQNTSATLSEKTFEATKLKEEVSQLTVANQDLKHQCEALSSDLQDITESLQASKAENESLQDSLARESQESQTLRGRLEGVAQNSDEQGKELSAKESETNMLRSTIEFYKSEVEDLKNQLQESRKRVSELEDSHEQATGDIKDLQDKLDESSRACELDACLTSQYRTDLEERRSALSALERELKKVDQERVDIQSQLEHERLRNTALEKALVRAQEDVSDQSQRRTAVSQSLEEEVSKYHELEGQNTILEQELQAVHTELDTFEQENEALKTELSTVQTQLHTREEEISNATRRSQYLDTDANIKTQQIHDLRENLQRCTDELDTKRVQLHSTETQLSASQITLKELRIKLEQKQSEVSSMESTLDLSRKALLEEQQKLVMQKSEFVFAQGELANERQFRQSDTSRLQREIEDSQNALEEVRAQYDSLVTTLHEFEDVVSEREATVADMQNQIISLEGGKQSIEERASVLQHDVDKLTTERNRQETEIAEMQSRLQDSAKQVHRLMRDLRDAHGEVTDVVRWRDEERSSHDTLRKEYKLYRSELDKELQETKTRIITLTSDLDLLRSQLTEAQQRVAQLSESLMEEESTSQQLRTQLDCAEKELHVESGARKELEQRYVETIQELQSSNATTATLLEEASELRESVQEAQKKIHNTEVAFSLEKTRAERYLASLDSANGELRDLRSTKEQLLSSLRMQETKCSELLRTEDVLRESVQQRARELEESISKNRRERMENDEQVSLLRSQLRTLEADFTGAKENAIQLQATLDRTQEDLNDNRSRGFALNREFEEFKETCDETTHKAREERDLFIQKYHSACYRNMQVEREAHEARQNYLNEYESFEQLRLNHDAVLGRLREKVAEREEKFRAALDQERKRIAELESVLHQGR